MLADAFVNQIQQRFSHEKRARVCLWFDPQAEFERLLPAIEGHLAKQERPPFHLLAYDPKSKHGQLWLKRRIWEQREEGEARFVLHLPLPEERLNGPDERGRHHLELLAEFQNAGIDWKVGGKRPTLFSFLKTAGVALPTDPGEQRRLTESGKDALLAKYSARFASKPPVFWQETITTELAQSRLVGDVDQAILDIAVDPDTKWGELLKAGHLGEFLATVTEKLGCSPDTDNPALWIKGLVETLALTEAFVGYGEPDDFPFADRLPPARYREHQVALVRRWLQDANCRGAWDRWVVEAEGHVNLSGWAKGKKGAAYGFPHLVTQRWEKAVRSLSYSGDEQAGLAERVAEMSPDIQREAEFGRASACAPGAWDTLLGFASFLKAAERARDSAEKAASMPECLQVYLEYADEVDGGHLRLKGEAQDRGLGELASMIDEIYGAYAKLLNQRFFDAYTSSDSLEIPGLPFVTNHLDAHVWSATGRRAVVIVDALRFDCALHLKTLLAGCDVRVEAVRAMLPTITPFGMSALLPSACAPTGLLTRDNARIPERNGFDLGQRQNRLKLLGENGAECREIDGVEATSKLGKLPSLLVVFGHEDVDSLGHASGDALIRHFQKEIERIARLVKKLHKWGYAEVDVVTDHGFILLDEEHLPDVVPLKKEWCIVPKERFAFVPANADLPIKSKPMPWDSSLRVAIPPGMAFFKLEKSFSHGGATLQEMVIPRLISRFRTAPKKVGVEILLAGAGANLASGAVKIVLRPVTVSAEGEFSVITASPRNLLIDVLREVGGKLESVLPPGTSKPIELKTTGEVPVTRFFDSKFTIQKGEQLRLLVSDADTGEQFPGPGGIILTASRTI